VWGDIQAARVLRPPPEKDDRQGVFSACCSSPRASQPAISVSLAFQLTNQKPQPLSWGFVFSLVSYPFPTSETTVFAPPPRKTTASPHLHVHYDPLQV
jgi:hypothetical protein